MNKLYNDTAVQAIANAIRAKNGSSDTYTIAEMSTALNDIGYYAKPTIENVPLATFEADGLPLNSLKVSVETKQDLHGYDKPWVGGAGKNKLPMTVDGIKALNTLGTWSGNDYTYLGMVYTILTDLSNNVIGIKANGTSTENYPNLYLPDMPINAGTYTLSGVPVGSDGYVIYFNSDAQITNGATKTFNIESDYIQTGIRLCVVNKATANNVIFYPQIESGSTATSFAPYSNECPISGWDNAIVTDTDDLTNPTITQTTTITLGQTVYGGEVDVVNGGGTETDVIAEYNSSEGWVQTTSTYNNLYQANLPSLMPQTNPTSISTRCECNQAEVWETREGSAVAINHDVTLLSTGSLSVVMLKIDGTSLTDLDNYLRAHPLQIKYPLATPTTFETQPTPIKSLNGTNNLSVDSGDVIELEYFKEV